MSKSFFTAKLERAIWVALVEQNRISDAVLAYEAFIKNIQAFEQFADFEKDAIAEISYSKKLFTDKLKTKYEEYFKNKDYSNAVLCCKYIYERDEKDETNLSNYIKCLEKLEQYDLQLLLAKFYLKTYNKSICYKLLSEAFDKNQEYKKAIEYYTKYLIMEHKTKPDGNDYNLIGCHYFNSYVKKGENPEDADNALKYFRRTIEEFPDNKAFLKNTIVAAMKAKQYDIEKECWKTYIEKGYASKEDEFTYSASCLRNGDIEEWGKYYGSRFEKNEPTIYPKINKPEWTGDEDLSDKTLLVHYEQGYGDNFLMFGYMPRLVKLAKHVIYYIQNNAYDLVKNNKFGVEVQCFKTAKLEDLEFDYHIPSMSLPIALHVNKETISVKGGYIKPDKEKVEEYNKKYFQTDKLKIGVAFAGISSNSKRDIPLKELLRLDDLDNVQLYCFTKDIPDETFKEFKRNNVINIAKDFTTFSDTAAALENTDIVISSDNCILNLAGAIGKKTLGMFNYHYEFRWYDLTGKDCGWYKSVIPIVNNKYNDWGLSMKTAIKYINEDIKKRR